MKKRLVSLMLAAVLSFGLMACGSSAGSADTGAEETGSETETASETDGTDTAETDTAAVDTAFPEKDITVICPYGAGGGTDLAMRIMADVAANQLGVNVTVENVTGGTGSIGLMEALAKEHDGYTLTFYSPDLINLPLLGIAPDGINKEAFDPVCMVNGEPAAIIVPADAKWNTIEEFVQDAIDNPGTIQLANAGMGNIWHLAAIGLELQTGAVFNNIPYDAGTSESLPALLGGHVDAVVCSVAEAASNIEAGELKVLAVANDDRLEGYPDVPTLKESGIDLVIVAMRALGVASDVPEETKAALADAFEEVVFSSEAEEACAAAGLTYMPKNAEETGELLDSMEENFSNIISAYLEQAE